MNEIEKLKEKQEELKRELEKLEIQINELEKKEITKSGKRWRADVGGKYYCAYSTGIVDWHYDNRDESSTNRYNLGNYFRTKEEAEKAVEKIKIYTRLKDLALRLNNGEKIDWENDDRAKWHICYKNGTALGFDDRYTCALQDLGQIYCLDSNFFDIAKREIGEEDLKKLFE